MSEPRWWEMSYMAPMGRAEQIANLLVDGFISREDADRLSETPGLSGLPALDADSKCEPWCGQTAEEMGYVGPLFCSAACLAQEMANQPAIPESPPRREPVAPWVRLSDGLPTWACAGWECSVGEFDETFAHESEINGIPAIYGKEERNTGACEACAERAGVFGPVAPVPVRKEWPRPTKPCHKCGGGPWTTVNAEGDWCGKCWEDCCRKRVSAHVIVVAPTKPTCAGPLATHWPPVVCNSGWARNAGKECGPPVARYGYTGKREPKKIYTCDVCALEWEKFVASMQEPQKPAEPPARVGTVPQVFGLNVGVWASRGMR